MRTHYSLEFKLQVLVALDSNDGNLYKTAQQFGIARSNVSDWHQRRTALFDQGETLMQQRRLYLAQRMELVINQIVDGMSGKVKQARLGDSARALIILLSLSDTLAAKKAKKSDVHEKLQRLMDRYQANSEAEGNAELANSGESL